MKSTTEYAIVMSREFYGPKTEKRRLIDSETGSEWRGSRAEAREEIKKLDSETYYTASGEVGRASYTIVKA